MSDEWKAARSAGETPSREDHGSKGFSWACPDCRTALENPGSCPGCGRDFETADGIPNLFPSGPITLSLDLEPAATDPREIRREVYQVPAVAGQRKDGVYHLDRAHQAIFEDLPEGATILETGCGGAQLRNWVRSKGLRYLGTDVSSERVHDWLQTHGGPDVLCDAHVLPFQDNSVDVVYASAVYEHLAYPVIAASEACRVLKPGGWFLCSASFLEPWHDESYNHMTANGMYAMLTAARLDPLAIWPEKAWPGFVAMLRMGNTATRPLAVLGRLMNQIYLMPRRVKHMAKTRNMPDDQALFEPRAVMAGAMACIAKKPETQLAPPS